MSSARRSFDSLPPQVLPLGLGCSRLGSVNGASDSEARVLLNAALEQGIRFFDTSNIYAQGDSERLIGEVLGKRDDCVVCSKAGKFLSWKSQVLVPVKGVLRVATRRLKSARQGVASARSKPMPRRWDPEFLQKSIDGSLRRLNRERIEVFMLHSPSAADLENGEAMGALELAQRAGKLGAIGVSPDDVEGAEAALKDPRVRFLQLPLRPGETDFDAVAKRATDSGVAVIAREILGGPVLGASAADAALRAKSRIIEVTGRHDVAMTLVGTTKLKNLIASADAARAGAEGA